MINIINIYPNHIQAPFICPVLCKEYKGSGNTGKVKNRQEKERTKSSQNYKMYNYSQLYIYSLLTVYTPDLMGKITIFQLQFQNHSRLIFYALDFIFLRIAPYFLRIALFYLLENVNFAIKYIKN